LTKKLNHLTEKFGRPGYKTIGGAKYYQRREIMQKPDQWMVHELLPLSQKAV
jgi:hypothetical protein